MKTNDEIKISAAATLRLEAECLLNIANNLDDAICEAVNQISQSKGRVIITGIGKSAIIAQKIVATFNSTGTASIFMHAADAIHGDLGIIQANDTIICISKSGNTPEIKMLIPLVKKGNNKIIAICGNLNSYLAQQADVILDTTVEKEACPNNLAPTTSTTAQLAMGDALAVCLLENKKFSSEDFAKFHPGGTLGKQLYLTVNDVLGQNEKPIVEFSSNIKNVLYEITSKRLGATAVVKNNVICGVITDGDIRRMLEKHDSFMNLTAADIMNKTPKTIEPESLAIGALSVLKQYNINQLLVMKNNTYLGFIHIQDLMREGIV